MYAASAITAGWCGGYHLFAQAAGAQLTTGFQRRIGGGAQMGVDALEVTQDIQMQ
jgi:hypothetical protein